MTLRPCPRQSEIQKLLASGHWPHACPADLRAHLADCRSCADLLLVTQAFQESRAIAAAEVRLPAPGAIWWRAQLRRRNASVERVGKPIFGAYVFAFSMMVFVAAALAISQARHGLRWLDWLGQSQGAALDLQAFNPLTLLNAGWSLAVLIPILATLALLGAVAVYLAGERQ
jgi:hypothetical protein